MKGYLRFGKQDHENINIPETPKLFSQILNQTQINRYIYNYLKNKELEKVRRLEMKWSQMFPAITLNWKSIYTNTLTATKIYKIKLCLVTITFSITHVIGRLDTQVKNFIMMAGNYFIFKSKYQKTIPSDGHFKSYLKHKIKIEKEIYFMKDRFIQFKRNGEISLLLLTTEVKFISTARKAAAFLSFISLLFFKYY